MFSKCAIVNCHSRRKDVNFYSFPKTEIGLKKWLLCINCDKLRNLGSESLRKRFVCQKHFERRFLAPTRIRSRLLTGAYPTLFSTNEILLGTPISDHSYPVSQKHINSEHSYALRFHHEDHTYSKADNVMRRGALKDLTNMSIDHTYAQITLPEDHSLHRAEEAKTHRMCQKEVINIDHDYAQINPPEDHALQKIDAMLSKGTILSSSSEATTSYCRNISPEPQSSKRNQRTATKDAPHTALRKIRTTAKRKVQTPKRGRKMYSTAYKSQKLKFSTFEKLTKRMNPMAKQFLLLQMKQCKKKPKGRRFNEEEKLICLSIMKQSPKSYRFLQKLFVLPTRRTLSRFTSLLNIEAGINAQVFEAIKHEVSNWTDNRKYCSILFDEVALDPAITYDKHKDDIDGFVHLSVKSNEFADHALVFMLRGAIEKWEQPLAFYFCKGATSALPLKNILKEIIVAVGETGLHPVALISDQGSAFQSALKQLQEETRADQLKSGDQIDDVVKINSHTLSVIYDPPHLLKGIRNNFLKKNIKYDGKLSSWNDIIEVYNNDCQHAQMRILPKLNDEHVIPEKIKKMKVKNCARVLSSTVAAALMYTSQFPQYSDGRQISRTLENTGETVSFLDNLFDSCNGTTTFSKKNKGKKLRKAVTPTSPHHEFWEEAITRLDNTKFVTKEGKEISVPSLKNWTTTLKSLQRLWKFFKTKSIIIMRPRYFNSDPIENFFGQVRAYNFRNNNPNCHSFKTTFKSLMITRFIKFYSEGYNCEEVSGEQLLKLKSIFKAQNKMHDSAPDSIGISISAESISTTSPESSGIQNAQLSAAQERIRVHSRAYTTGWVTRKILEKVNCSDCTFFLSNTDNTYPKNNINNWIAYKEYKAINMKKLTYPTEEAVMLFGNIGEETNNYLEKNPENKNIIKNIKEIIKAKYSAEFLKCNLHRDAVFEYFIILTLRLTIFNWCSIINKILKGTDVSRLKNKSLPPMQLKAYNTYLKKLKNKKVNN